MNERELDRAKAETYKRVVEFARDAVEKEKNVLENEIAAISNDINNFVASGINFGDYRVRKLEENLKRERKLLEKVTKDLDYLNDILRKFNNVVFNSLNPDEKKALIKELKNKFEDMIYIVDPTQRNNRIQDLNNKINSIKSYYDPLIKKEGNEEKRRELTSKRQKEINNLEDRLKDINKHSVKFSEIENKVINDNPGLSPSDLQILINSEINNYINVEKQKIIDEINRVRAIPEKTYEEQLQESILLVKPLFTKYTNQYGGSDVTVKEYGGESVFKYIMKSTNVYSKMSAEINALENKLSVLNANNNAKGKSLYDLNQDLKGEVSRNQMLPYRIRDMKNKKNAILAEQKLVMLRRQQVIDKKNYQISRLEGKTEQLKQDASRKTATNPVTRKIESANSVRRNFKAWRTDVRINVLKNKPIIMLSTRAFLLKERLRDELFKKSTDANGNWDSRSWQERAVERMEEKSQGKTL